MRLAQLEPGEEFAIELGSGMRIGRVLSKTPSSVQVEYPKYETVTFRRSNGRKVSFSRSHTTRIAHSTQVTRLS